MRVITNRPKCVYEYVTGAPLKRGSTPIKFQIHLLAPSAVLQRQLMSLCYQVERNAHEVEPWNNPMVGNDIFD